MAQELPTIYYNAGSKWWWCSWYSDDGRHRFSLKRFGLSVSEYTKEEALGRFLQVIGRNPAEPEPGDETVAWAKGRFLAAKAPHIRLSTFKEYRIALDHFERFTGGLRPLSGVKRLQVVEFQQRLLDAGAKPATVNKTCRHIRHFFGWLVEVDVLQKNPFSNFPNIDEETGEKKHLAQTELRHFLDTMWNDHPIRQRANFDDGIKRLVMICVATGLRRNEIMLIERGDVDLTNNRVRVMNIKHKKRPKRWITIPESIRDDIAWFLDTFESTMPFSLCHPDTLSHRVKVWLRKAGLPESLHLHSLRHTFATLALNAGESSWRLKDHLGHSSISLLENTYAHTDVDDGKAIDIGMDITRADNSEHNG